MSRDKGRVTVALTVRLPRGVWKELREVCHRHSLSMQGVAVEAIRQELKEYGIYRYDEDEGDHA